MPDCTPRSGWQAPLRIPQSPIPTPNPQSPTPVPTPKPQAMSKPLYKVVFHNHGKVYELYARRVVASGIWGFTEVGELVFDVHDGVVVDPTEERLRDEFGNTRVLHLPMQSIVRVEE